MSNDHLAIKKVETSKNKIFQRKTMEENIIPRFPSVTLLISMIGGGKTTLLINLLENPNFYGKSIEGVKKNKDDSGEPEAKPYHDFIFWLTNSDDDMLDTLIKKKIVDEKRVVYHPSAIQLQQIIDAQAGEVKQYKDKMDKAPRTLIVLDDVVDNAALLKSPAFKTLFVRPRQLNVQVIILSQYLNLIPKALRNQATNIMFFKGNKNETEIILDQFNPNKLKRKEFEHLVAFATEPDQRHSHPFLHIVKKEPEETRFRKSLDIVLKLKNNQ